MGSEKKIIVAGAGIIGITTAFRLHQAGYDVTVIDKEAQPAQGTSFANGGQIAACGIAPWAGPGIWREILPALLSSHSPVGLKWSSDPAQWRWIFDFIRHASARCQRRNAGHLLALALFSQKCLAQTQVLINAPDSVHQSGILRLFKKSAALKAISWQTDMFQAHGLKTYPMSPPQAVEIEPALAPAAANGHFTAALHCPSDQAGDAAGFTQLLADYLAQNGVRFIMQTNIEDILWAKQGTRPAVTGLKTSAGRLEAEGVVLSLGTGTRPLTRKSGIDLPVYPVKGYSITIPITEDSPAPKISLTDEKQHIVVSNLGDRLRIAGMAELRGYDTQIHNHRIALLKAQCKKLLPDLIIDDADISPWTALRPVTPTGMPLIGKAIKQGREVANLYLNTGHGFLGWTLAHSSAALLTSLIEGTPPAFNPAAFAPSKF